MTFRGILAEVIDWLQQDQRISYRALQRHFDLDDAYLQDIKDAILYAHPATDDGRGLIWTGDLATNESDARRGTGHERHFQVLLPAVMAWLRQEGRVTYHTLKYVFGIDETLLAEIRKELPCALRQRLIPGVRHAARRRHHRRIRVGAGLENGV